MQKVFMNLYFLLASPIKESHKTPFYYRPFHKTLPKSSLQKHWTSARFYELGDNWNQRNTRGTTKKTFFEDVSTSPKALTIACKYIYVCTYASLNFAYGCIEIYKGSHAKSVLFLVIEPLGSENPPPPLEIIFFHFL